MGRLEKTSIKRWSKLPPKGSWLQVLRVVKELKMAKELRVVKELKMAKAPVVVKELKMAKAPGLKKSTRRRPPEEGGASLVRWYSSRRFFLPEPYPHF